jgi:hypothetical protein
VTKPFEIAIAPPRRGDPSCIYCGGSGELRLPTAAVYDVVIDCDCATPVPAEVEAERVATWDRVLP